MDLIYMTDATSYHTIRSPHYVVYEDKFKENDYYNKKKSCGPTADSSCKSKKSNPEHSCKICKEKQRRQLFNLIKARTQKTSITEEEESEESNENENVKL
ncbi:hypothetical protein WDU94_007934 [Cyamophila willieti]